MSLEYPYIALVALIFLIIWWIFFREKIGYSYPNPLMWSSARIPLKVVSLWILRILLIFLIFFLLSWASIERQEKVLISDGKNIVFLLDISKSMLADDIAPNRLERAKEVLISFLRQESVDRYGLVIFAGKAFILSPLTMDLVALQKSLSNVTTDMIKQFLPGLSGTNIGDALLAGEIVDGDIATGSTLILITDGRANIGIDPRTAARALALRWVVIHTIAIGSSSGGVLSYRDSRGVRQYFYDESWEKIRSDIDTDMLLEISEITGGSYAYAGDVEALERIFERYRATLVTEPRYEYQLRKRSLDPFILSALILLGILHSVLVAQSRYW